MASIIDATRTMETTNESWKVSKLAAYYEPPSDDHPEEGGGRLFLPPHQRLWSWKGTQGLRKQRKLIDTVLHGFPVPGIILNSKDDGMRERWQVYDGRHRIETLHRFTNNKFGIKVGETEVFYKDLSPADRTTFDNRFIPVVVAAGATFSQLAEVFIRLNSGKALTNADYCHASKDSTLIRGTIAVLTPYTERFRMAFGGVDILGRKSIPDWVGIVLGLTLGMAGNMTTSFIRVQEYLDTEVDVGRVTVAMDALVELYTRANAASVLATKALCRYSKLGLINAFFLADWMKAPVEKTVADWVRVILHIRSEDDDSLVRVSGAQNLNDKKISVVLDNVHKWLATGNAVPALPADSDESDDGSEDSDE
jgi:hypothetical protein